MLLSTDTAAQVFKEVQMPFTWGALYFASMSFFGAQILYLIFCPRIIRRYASLEDYRQKDGSFRSISDELCFLSSYLTEEKWEIIVGDIVDTPLLEFPNTVTLSTTDQQKKALVDDPISTLRGANIAENMLPDLFAIVRSTQTRRYMIIRLFAVLLQMLGFTLIAWAVIENTLSVLRYYGLG